jgi:hypothetical protein
LLTKALEPHDFRSRFAFKVGMHSAAIRRCKKIVLLLLGVLLCRERSLFDRSSPFTSGTSLNNPDYSRR